MPEETVSKDSKSTGILKYREYLSDEVKANNNDLQKNLIYIIAGALGLFLTLNEKLINLKNSQKAWILIISVSSLLIALMLIIVLSYRSAASCMKLIQFIDKEKNNEGFNESMKKAWKQRNDEINLLKGLLLTFFFGGIITEVVFVYFNIFFK